MTLTELSSVLQELRPALIGGWVQKIHQPSPTSLTLDFRLPGKSLTLYISADPRTSRVHLLHRRLPNPPLPPSFCQFLRSHIQGSQLTGIDQVPHDRIMTLQFHTPQQRYSLTAALTGRHANILVLNEQGTILRSLVPALGQVGHTYRLPTPRHLSSTQEPGQMGPSTHVPFSETGPHDEFPLSRALEERYLQAEMHHTHEQAQHIQTGSLRKHSKKLRRKIAAYEKDLLDAARYKEYRRYGELLKHHLKQVHQGQISITVVDYFDEALPEVTLSLDPSKSPTGNLESYFRKHRKYLGAERELRPRLEQAREDLTNCLNQLEAVQMGQRTFEGPLPMPHTSQRFSHSRQGPSPPVSSVPYRRFRSVDGLRIFVGRNAQENDRLTFRDAHSHDLWFHTRGTPGSHVLLKVEKSVPPPHESIRDAAVLALLYSDRKKSGKGEVIYTQKKYVKKAKGQKPGAVLVSQEKSIWAELDQERLHRLKTSGIHG